MGGCSWLVGSQLLAASRGQYAAHPRVYFEKAQGDPSDHPKESSLGHVCTLLGSTVKSLGRQGGTKCMGCAASRFWPGTASNFHSCGSSMAIYASSFAAAFTRFDPVTLKCQGRPGESARLPSIYAGLRACPLPVASSPQGHRDGKSGTLPHSRNL